MPGADARVREVPDLESVLAGLNDSQREAALALRGPVAILAGAGTGKTTTITHRIACQVRSGEFDASQILAVTFTDKAAGELKRRLQALEVEGVEARTFHSAALSQLSRLWSAHTGEPLPDVLDHKAPLIASLANALPPPHKFLPRRELAGEIEWAKNRMIPPARYLAELGDHEPPIPAELMLRIYDGYERRKRAMGRLDFEDMLGLALQLFDEHPDAAEAVRSRFSAFTVDEFQDVNPLQAGLLERWLGDARRPLRRGRRLPDDLRVHGRVARAPAGLHASLPARDGRSPRGELPLHPRGPRAREPARAPTWAGSGRPFAQHALRSVPGGARRTRRGRRGRGRRRGGPDGCTSRRPCRSRRSRCCTGSTPGPSRSRRPSPPRASRIRCATERSCGDPDHAAVAAAAEASERGRRRARGRRRHHRPARLRPRGVTRRRRGGDAPVRPGADALPRGGVRGRRSRRRPRGVPGGAGPPVLDRAQRPRGEPAHLSPREGAGVRRRVPSATDRRRAPVPFGASQGRPAGGAAAALRRDHARASIPLPHVAGRRSLRTEPVPRRDGALGRRSIALGRRLLVSPSRRHAEARSSNG